MTGTTARALHRKYLPLMQANFIESSPLPVKAVLAMMGKIQEIYRLPLLPMRRDTRSKLQKIATDVGLLARPAAACAGGRVLRLRELGCGTAQSHCASRHPAGNAVRAKVGLQATIRNARAGTALTLTRLKLARPRIRCPEC